MTAESQHRARCLTKVHNLRLQQVVNNGARFPQLQAALRVFNGRHSAIGIDRFKRLFFQVALCDGSAHSPTALPDRETDEIHHDAFVRNAEFLHDDGDLPWVGALVDVSGVKERLGMGMTYTGVGVELHWLSHCEDGNRISRLDKLLLGWKKKASAHAKRFVCLAQRLVWP